MFEKIYQVYLAKVFSPFGPVPNTIEEVVSGSKWVKVGEILAGSREEAFEFLQSNRRLMMSAQALGLNHVTFSVGDVLLCKDESTGWVCENFGWHQIKEVSP